MILTSRFLALTCALHQHFSETCALNTDPSRRTYTTKLVKSGKPDKKLDRKKPVLVERRIINHKGQHTHTEVDVKSPALRNILIEINKDVEGLSLLKEPPFVSRLVSPPAQLPTVMSPDKWPFGSHQPWYRILCTYGGARPKTYSSVAYSTRHPLFTTHHYFYLANFPCRI